VAPADLSSELIQLVSREAGFKHDIARFLTLRLSSLDRGFSYAIAHVRGGELMGAATIHSTRFIAVSKPRGAFGMNK